MEVRQDSFPAPSKQASGSVNGLATEVEVTNFSDKILVTISQAGHVAQWIQVPLSASSPALADLALPAGGRDMLPSTHLTPRTLLGGGGEQRETLGHLLAAQIASHLCLRNPEERRTMLLGLGLAKVDTSRETFFDLIELAQRVL